MATIMIQKKSPLQTEEISANIPAKHQDSKIFCRNDEYYNNTLFKYNNTYNSDKVAPACEMHLR